VTTTAETEVETPVKRRSLVRGLVKTIRPSQWVKNVFVLAPMVFHKDLVSTTSGGDAALNLRVTGQALVATVVFCLLAGAVKALPYALELGRQADGCVTVLNALEYMDPEEPCEHVDFDIRARRQHFIDHARERLHAQLAQQSTTWCELKEVVAIDRAYKAILQHAAALQADLIVMGAQGTSGLELMVYGSNTQHVARAATCPLLTVHA
jgi:nucleotide-binding universal stress UspA family protein